MDNNGHLPQDMSLLRLQHECNIPREYYLK